MSTYSYRQLQGNEIRLLRILPYATNEDAIQCEISHYPLETAPAYQAFSYSWNEKSAAQNGLPQTSNICIGGQNLKIQHNLNDLLVRMRERQTEQQEGFFWADAICINQTDLDERGRQVLRMVDIFSRAKSVLVWLGVGGDNSDSAFRFLNDLAQQDDINISSEFIRKSLITRSHDSQWFAMKHLLSRSWWSRTWVVQEVACAQNVTVACGDEEVEWSIFSMFQKATLMVWREIVFVLRDQLYIELDQAGLNGLNAICHIRDKKSSQKQMTLLELNNMINMSLTTEPVDKLYGILSLATDARTMIPQPSYKKPLQQVFMDVVSCFVNEYKSLNLLSYCERAKVVDDLPSWTPDFSSNKFFVSITEDPLDTSKPAEVTYRAAGQMPMTVTICSASGTLTATGFVLGEVDGLGVCAFAQGIEGKQDKQSTSAATMYGDNTGIVSALWRTIVGDRVWTSTTCGPAPPEFGDHFLKECTWTDEVLGDRPGFQPGKGTRYRETGISDFEKWYQQDRNFKIAGRSIRDRVREVAVNSGIVEAQPQPFNAAFEASRSIIEWGKRLFTTVNGYIGMAPAETQPTDEVCIFGGCSMPMIVRPLEDDCYELIGECFVEGVMSGELLQHNSKNLPQPREFVLV